MATKESKKIVKMYNKVAKALIEFEALWHQAWLRSIEQCKAGLAAPLLVQHPNTGKLLVRACAHGPVWWRPGRGAARQAYASRTLCLGKLCRCACGRHPCHQKCACLLAPSAAGR